MSALPALPTLLTRMSSRPKRSMVRATASSAPAGVDRSAATASTRSAPAEAARSAAAASSASLPRAVSTTLQPSAASDRALARPRPLLEPEMRATEPVRPRSTGALVYTPPGEIVQAPVKRPELHLDTFLEQGFLLTAEQVPDRLLQSRSI